MSNKKSMLLAGLLILMGLMASYYYNVDTAEEVQAQGPTVIKRFTTTDDFDKGVKVNLNATNDALKLNSDLTTFPFIWVAASDLGTVVKINTETGEVLGEYYTAPKGRATNPSRTTVDLKGNVWVTNRNETSNGLGSVVHVGLKENGQCVDRNGNGQIDTSTGLGDLKTWNNTGGADNNGGVSTAADECILHYIRTSGTGMRHVSVNADNNVWVGGYTKRSFDLIDGNSGKILKSVGPFTCGGYGGLMDGNGVLWSTRGDNKLLRYDTKTDKHQCLSISDSYGMGIDSKGNIWTTIVYSNKIVKLNPDGTVVGTYDTKVGRPRGVAVSPIDDNVWVALDSSSSVARFDNNGNLIATVALGNDGKFPIGVSVDAAGKVWATNQLSNNAVRIDPATNKVDKTVALRAGSAPYNYSDMTGIVAFSNTAPQGTWTEVYDSGKSGQPWQKITWVVSEQPAGSTVTVRVRVAETEIELNTAKYVEVTSGVDVSNLPNGRFIQIEVKLTPGTDGKSPVVDEVVVEGRSANDCKLVQDKTAAPKEAPIGTAVKVTLSLKAVGTCDAVNSPIDVMLVIDRSGSMNSDRKIQKAQEAAKSFIGKLAVNDRAGLASFASTNSGRLDQALTGTMADVSKAIDKLAPGGTTNIIEGLEKAEQELTANAKSSSAPVIILLSDGAHNATADSQLNNAAKAIKAKGVRIIAIGLGKSVDEKQLKEIASSTDDYYYAPTPDQLNGIYDKIAPTTRVAAKNIVLTDMLSQYATLITGTFEGPVQPASVNGKTIVWNISAVPADKAVELSYDVSMTSRAGTWPTNDSATATYIDTIGGQVTLTFPVPQVTVPILCEQPKINDVDPQAICVGQDATVKINGSGFFDPTDPVSGTFGIAAYIGPQKLTISSNTKDTINAKVASGIPVGTHSATIVNTCAITDAVNSDTGKPPADPLGQLPTSVFSYTLENAFNVYPAPNVLSVRPPEGYESIPNDITICGEGFAAAGTKAYIKIDGQEIDLNSQTYGDSCIVGAVPSKSDPTDGSKIKPGVYEIIVRGPCGEAKGEYRILSDSLNDDLWSPELWVTGKGVGDKASGICVRLSDEIDLGAFINRRGGKDPIVGDLTITFYEGKPGDINPIKIGDATAYIPPRVNATERISGVSTSAVRWRPAKTGLYDVYAVIDSGNIVNEDVEDNNVVSRTIQVLPPADKTPSGDGIAPNAITFTVNGGKALARQREITLATDITDYAQIGVKASGVYSYYIVELIYNPATGAWVPVAGSGWKEVSQLFDVSVTEVMTWTLAPQGGLRFIQIWSADKEGNVSRYPYQQQVSFMSSCERVARDGTRTYRQDLKAGDKLYVEVASCNGDPDLYIWPPDWNTRGAYVSNQQGNALETTPDGGYVAQVDGTYAIEVYGYSSANFSISIDVDPANGQPRDLTTKDFSANVSPDKPARQSRANDPTGEERLAPDLPPDSVPNITAGVPPPVVSYDPVDGGNDTYLPAVVKE